MKQIREQQLNNLVFIDIETARLTEILELDTPLFDSWAYKWHRNNFTNVELQTKYINEAALYAEFAKVIVVTVGMIKNDKFVCKSYYNESEKTLLENFTEGLHNASKSNKNTKLCGFAIKGFDLPFLSKRCTINQIESHELIDTGDAKPWEVTSVDLAEIWKGTGFNKASLISVVTALEIPSPKSDISGWDVGRVYYGEGNDGLNRIKEYCERDVLATANIVNVCKFKGLLKHSLESLEESDDVLSIEMKTSNLLDELFNGGAFGIKEKKRLTEYVKSIEDDSDRDLVFTTLLAIPSNAKGSKTKITKKWVMDLKKSLK